MDKYSQESKVIKIIDVYSVIAALLVLSFIILCFGSLFYFVELNAKQQKEELELKIVSFCGREPVKIVNTYIIREGTKRANYSYPAYAVIEYNNLTMTVKFDCVKDVVIGEKWYLKTTRKGDYYYITLDNKVSS